MIGAQSAVRILCGLFPDHLSYGGMEAGMHSQFDQFGLPDIVISPLMEWFCLRPSPVFLLKSWQLSENEAELLLDWACTEMHTHGQSLASFSGLACSSLTYVHWPIHWLTYNSFLVTTESTYTAQSSGNLKLCKAPPGAEVLWQDAPCLG